ncbi:hypothetical protein ACH5RR_024651 [Cinchona calisaya]|uniref:Retrotransposon gag domain-containing protein n=1 Tax=Cinchona calisaya TaxID=153742 RepID=A0ABD2YXB6_9GENT
MTQMISAITRVTEVLERQNRQGNANHLGEDGALECFLKFKPSEFVGEPDDEKAEAWIEHVESIFVTLKYEDERNIAFSTFQLRGTVREWWRTIKIKWKNNKTECT